MLWLTTKKLLSCNFKLRANEAKNMQDVLEPQAKTKARLERRRGEKRESTQPSRIWRKEVEIQR